MILEGKVISDDESNSDKASSLDFQGTYTLLLSSILRVH